MNENEILNYLIYSGYITQEEFDQRVAQYKQEIDSRPKNPDEIFLSLDYNSINIQDMQEKKIEQLDYLCNKEILNGFDSSVLGVVHNYPFDYEAQQNMSAYLILVNVAPEGDGSTYWKTNDAGVLLHSKEEFVSLCKDAQNHKQGKIARYWMLKAQVLAAEDVESILAINWVN